MWLIYMFADRHNGQKYIGCTDDLNMRVSGHLREANKSPRKFYQALRERTILGFDISILESSISTKGEALARERFHISVHDSFSNGYNSNEGGGGRPKGSIPWNKGKTGVYTDEQRDHLSTIKRGKATTQGRSNPRSADNARRGAEKQRQNAVGRRRYELPTGGWTWMYPRANNTWYVKEQVRKQKWREVDVTPPLETLR